MAGVEVNERGNAVCFAVFTAKGAEVAKGKDLIDSSVKSVKSWAKKKLKQEYVHTIGWEYAKWK